MLTKKYYNEINLMKGFALDVRVGAATHPLRECRIGGVCELLCVRGCQHRLGHLDSLCGIKTCRKAVQATPHVIDRRIGCYNFSPNYLFVSK